ncbi:PAS domain S-box protein [Pelodictyon luteolum]|uniref:PAS domain S-box protein n=1 Tax=Pelodictyon luteolum TaxID=1100 RepID=UPI000AE964FD|nr:PAS domain S-box protein [Pelodictyon luteolum]
MEHAHEQLIKENERLRQELALLRAKTCEGNVCQTLEMAAEASRTGTWDWNIATGELRVNGRWAEMIGFSLPELGHFTFDAWRERCHPNDLEQSELVLREYFEGKRDLYEVELRMLHRDGHWVWVVARGKVFERNREGKPIRMVGSHHDVTERKAAEEALTRNLGFERLITALSNRFISLGFEEIDGMIMSILQLIGEFVGADRSYVFQFSDDLQLIDNTHEWCAEGTEPQIDALKGLPTDIFPWWMERVNRNESILLPRIEELPIEAAAERDILEAQDIKSLIVIPLTSGSIPFGYIGFDAVHHEMEWQPDTVAILKFAGGIIANALQRQRAEQCIQAELDLAIKLNTSASFQETLAFCLDAAMSVSGMDCGGVYLVNNEKKTITLAYHEGLSDAFVREAANYPFDSQNARIIREGKPIYHQFNRLLKPEKKEIDAENLQAIAIIPIMYKGEVIGNLNVASHTISQVPEFARKALETVTAHIGSAIMQARHEEEIATSKTNFEVLFDTIDDFLFIVDMDGLVIHTNRTVRKRLGYTADELQGCHVLHFHPEEQWKQAEANITAMLTGTGEACLVPLKTKSGELIPVETRVTPGTWNSRPVLFGTSRDMSERVRAEEALMERERRFRELTEFLPLPLFEINLQGMVTYSNNKATEVFGYAKEEFADNFPVARFTLPEERDRALLNMSQMLAGQRPANSTEYGAIKKDGSRIPMLLYSSPIAEDGVIRGIRGIAIDLTDLKKAEEALRNIAIQQRLVSEFQTLIDNIPGAVYRINREGKTAILSMVDDFQSDFSKEQFEAELFNEPSIIHPDDREAVLSSNRSIGESAASATLTYRIIASSGAVRWIEDRRTPAFAEDGAFTGIDGILFDITERVRIQEDKRDLESRLRNTQRLETIGTLAGGIAHDFNNILTPVLGYAEMGALEVPEENPLYDYFREIVQAAERAKNLVAQILTFSRAQESEPAAVKVQSIITEALKLLRPSIPATITIRKDIAQKCGNVLADPSQIHQVIINLCTNAFQAMEGSGGTLTLELSEIPPGSGRLKMFPRMEQSRCIHLSISDTGPGMDEATMERIFEPFFTTKSVNKGTGLGLSVVHGIITSYNGEITVESQPGSGAPFHVYLPVINEEIHEEPMQEPMSGGSGRILFVDDEMATVQLMQEMIPKLGFSIACFNSPHNALEAYRNGPDLFDLLLTDLTMPEMTGIELARNVHQLNPALPVILLTGYGKDIELTSPLNRYGITKFLKKPVQRSELGAAINEVISANKPQRA